MTDLTPILRAGFTGSDCQDLVPIDPATVRWAVHAGLGPYLYYYCRRHPGITDRPSQNLLNSANMVAQLSMSAALDALEFIFAASAEYAREIVLLKGISVCQRLYPEPHLRTMGDIDLLVPEHIQKPFEILLIDLGYRQQSSRPASFYQTHHHSMPFFHPANQVWIEVHTRLFSNTLAAADPIFSPSHIDAHTLPHSFRGYRTNRFDLELELAYIAAHWGIERKCFAGGAVPMMDMTALVRNFGNQIDWDQLVAGLNNSHTAVYLRLMLGYLNSQEILSIPATVMKRLSVAARYALGKNETILYGMINRYTMQGRRAGRVMSKANLGTIWDALLEPQPAWKNFLATPFKVIFPPGQRLRYNMGFQIARLAGALGLRKTPP